MTQLMCCHICVMALSIHVGLYTFRIRKENTTEELSTVTSPHKDHHTWSPSEDDEPPCDDYTKPLREGAREEDVQPLRDDRETSQTSSYVTLL